MKDYINMRINDDKVPYMSLIFSLSHRAHDVAGHKWVSNSTSQLT